MKQLLSALMLLSISILLLRCTQVGAKKQRPSAATEPAPLSSSVKGAWRVVQAERDGVVTDLSNHIQVKMFTDESFFLMAHDSAGNIKFAGYGKYGFEGDTYHETFQYHTHRPYWGGMDWQDLAVRGDTMYLNEIKKVVVSGKDITAGRPKIREKLVRIR